MVNIDIDQLLAATEEMAEDTMDLAKVDIDRLLELTDDWY